MRELLQAVKNTKHVLRRHSEWMCTRDWPSFSGCTFDLNSRCYSTKQDFTCSSICIEHLSVLGCYALSIGKGLPTSRTVALPSSEGSRSRRTVSLRRCGTIPRNIGSSLATEKTPHPWWLKSSIISRWGPKNIAVFKLLWIPPILAHKFASFASLWTYSRFYFSVDRQLSCVCICM